MFIPLPLFYCLPNSLETFFCVSNLSLLSSLFSDTIYLLTFTLIFISHNSLFISFSFPLPPSLSFLPPLPPSYFSLFLVLPPFYFSLPLIFLFSYSSQSCQVYNPWAPDSRSFIYVTPAGMFHTPLVGSRHCLGEDRWHNQGATFGTWSRLLSR